MRGYGRDASTTYAITQPVKSWRARRNRHIGTRRLLAVDPYEALAPSYTKALKFILILGALVFGVLPA